MPSRFRKRASRRSSSGSISDLKSASADPRLRSPLHYQTDTLIGRQVCAVVNFPPRQIGPFVSEVLTLGLPDLQGSVVLIRPDFKVPDGGKLF